MSIGMHTKKPVTNQEELQKWLDDGNTITQCKGNFRKDLNFTTKGSKGTKILEDIYLIPKDDGTEYDPDIDWNNEDLAVDIYKEID